MNERMKIENPGVGRPLLEAELSNSWTRFKVKQCAPAGSTQQVSAHKKNEVQTYVASRKDPVYVQRNITSCCTLQRQDFDMSVRHPKFASRA